MRNLQNQILDPTAISSGGVHSRGDVARRILVPRARFIVRTGIILICLCLQLCVGKIPPTLPACPEEEELKVADCQKRLNASLVTRLPGNRMFFTGHIQPTELIQVCLLINQHSACDTNSLGFCRRIRPTPPPTDYFFISLTNFCYNGAFNDYPTLFLCYQSASKLTSSCYAGYQNSLRKAGFERSESWMQSSQQRREANCGLYDNLIECVSEAIKELCGGDAVRLVEPLLEISIPASAFCTSNKYLRYMMQADQLVGSGNSDAAQKLPGDSSVSADSNENSSTCRTVQTGSLNPMTAVIALLLLHVLTLIMSQEL